MFTLSVPPGTAARLLLACTLASLARPVAAQTRPTIFQATIGEQDPVTPEISTEELRQLLAEGKIPILDVRSAQEYAIAHIPGSISLDETEPAQITTAYPDKHQQLVLYCNGPFLAGLRHIMDGDRTAVWVDARRGEEFARGSLPRAVNIRPGEADEANEDGRLPQRDKGTRVIVFANSGEDARAVAVEIARKAYWNSSSFGGSFRDLTALAAR
jgi:rhodanese-related sulfurtransferase